MPKRKDLPVKSLRLDLHNYRTVAQANEVAAIHAMIAIEPDRLWALMESLLDDGFTLAENILVLKQGSGGKQLMVAEGNRRVAAMKIALGLINRKQFELPAHIDSKIGGLSSAWKAAHAKLPCVVYGASEEAAVDREISRIHGKGEKAGRDPWSSVARARHNRDRTGQPQPELDLLESYVAHGRNSSETQKESWGGDFPLTVLEEAIDRIASRLGLKSGKEVAASYPKSAAHRSKIEAVIFDIGMKTLRFPQLRSATEDVLSSKYGFPAQPAQPASGTGSLGTPGARGTGSPSGGGVTGTGTSAGSTATGSGAGRRPNQSHSLTDQRAVRKVLKDMSIKHGGREKVVTLRDELLKLDLRVTPHAFCFVLRSVFEISAKAFCDEHKKSGGPSTQKSPGQDKFLIDVLRDIVKYMTSNMSDREVVRKLTGAIAELAKSDGFLSVTSMNQLVHHRSFNVNEGHICSLFFNVFPLLEAMNA